MPSSVVHAGVALVLGVGLLGRHYSSRAIVVVALAVVVAEIDTVAGLVIAGAHRTVLHSLVVTGLATAGLLWETHREGSWLRARFGPAGIRVAWVALFVHVFAHLLFDWAHLDGINVLWPLHDQFFRIDGRLYYSTAEGVVQTFVDLAEDPDTGRRVVDPGGRGTRRETHIGNPVQPSPDPGPDPVDRVFPIAVQGWQLYLVVTGLFAVAARHVQSRPPTGGR